MPTSPKYPLYELSGAEFERLCIELLMATDPKLTVSAGEAPRWLDAVGIRKTKEGLSTVAIEAKHRTVFHPEGLRLFLERLSQEDRKFDEYIFITSSPIQDPHRQLASSPAALALHAKLTIIGQEELLSLLQRHPEVAAKFFASARERLRKQRLSASVSAFAIGISASMMASVLYDSLRATEEPTSQLSEQVKVVEASLARLHELERNLQGLKGELQQKATESARITKEYEEAMKLKALTTEQLEQVKKAVSNQSGSDIFLNYFFGFLLGVAGSVLATVITDKWKQWRALREPYA